MTQLFGTNGIRGIVNTEMTGKLALEIAQAWGTYLTQTIPHPQIVLGTDARISNAMLKSAMISGFLSTGCTVVDVGIVPTPTLQYVVKVKQFDSGVVITASHNPPEFNGIKGIDSDGTEFSKNVEESIEKIFFQKQFRCVDWSNVGTLSVWDGAIACYLKAILSIVDVDLIKKQRFHVVLDCGNGTGGLVTPLLLQKLGCTVTTLFSEPDGLFPGRNSEPTQENLGLLMKTVKQTNKVVFGIAQDGDADRAIFVDEKGTYLWGDTSLALIGIYLTKKNSGGVLVTAVNTSMCFEDAVKKYGGTVIYTKIGSPTVAREMIKRRALFGGEENGGLIFPQFQYCRDSMMSLAVMLEILASEQKPLSELVKQIPTYARCKKKIPCPKNKNDAVMKAVIQEVSTYHNVKRIDQTDGVKVYLDKGWVLVRPSGTEPILRVYAESKVNGEEHSLASAYLILLEKIIKTV